MTESQKTALRLSNYDRAYNTFLQDMVHGFVASDNVIGDIDYVSDPHSGPIRNVALTTRSAVGTPQLLVYLLPIVDHRQLTAIAVACFVQDAANAARAISPTALSDESISAALDSLQ